MKNHTSRRTGWSPNICNVISIAAGFSIFGLLLFLALEHYGSTSYRHAFSSSATALQETKARLQGFGVSPNKGSKDAENFAYVQYATNRQYLCNVLINVARLRKLGVAAQIAVMVPSEFLEADINRPVGKMMESLKKHGAHIHALDLQSKLYASVDATYAHSLQKLEIFNLPYDRVVFFDSDGLINNSLDHLFTALDSDLLMAEAYYTPARTPGQERTLSSALMVIRPSKDLYDHLILLAQSKAVNDYDMELINKLARSSEYRRRIGILPWHKYLVLTGVFRNPEWYFYSGSSVPTTDRDDNKILLSDERDIKGYWNPRKLYEEAYYIHFSDWPIPKPWIDDKGASYAQHGPKCQDSSLTSKQKADGDCEEVKVWREIYRAFKDEMMELCPSTSEID